MLVPPPITDAERAPEDEEYPERSIQFDPSSSRSIRTTQQLLMARYGLKTPPALCKETWGVRAWRRIKAIFGR